MLRFVAILLCITATCTPGYCERGASRDVEHAGLPEFLTELDLSSLEASEEDVEALKKIVKRLAPEKNGEYQVYQVFFGNEDLLKEWLKGAGVTGQPGVDYPALTSIPATSFSCRGLRGGYYADLETNCQVFHICDNGRKISFLCPNGTIFQQSQLICDWWFKVDCSRSTELYEQSAEQLAEEEKKRADARKMKSEHHRTLEQQGDVNYYDSQSVDYDGRQNGRTNPYGQVGTVKQNQLSDRQEEPKSAQNFGPNNVFDNTRDSGRYFATGNNAANGLRVNDQKTNQSPDSFNQPTKQRPDGGSSHHYQANNRQRNQLVEHTQSAKFNYEHSNKFQDTRQNYQTISSSSAQPDRYRPASQNAARDSGEKGPDLRGPKARTSTWNNLFGASQSPKATPTYMETTTFRTTTVAPSPKEYQQFAESAAFVSNRGNRFNSAKYDNARQQLYYQQSYHSGLARETTTPTPANQQVSFTPKTGVPPYPGPTYAPIYRPRTTTLPPYETTLQYTPTTEANLYGTAFYNRQPDVSQTTYFNYETTATTEDYSTTESSAARDYQRTPAAIGRVPPAIGNHRNQYSIGHDGKMTDQRDTSRDVGSFATTRPYLNTESYRYNTANVTSAVTQVASNRSSTPLLESSSSDGATTTRVTNQPFDVTDDAKTTTKDPWRTSSQNFRHNSISSTEKPWRSTNVYQQSGSTSKTLSPYDTSFTYKQGKVLSTLGPYVPFTKNYVYSTSTSTPMPLATVAAYNPTNYRLTTSNLIPKMKSTTSRPKDRATYLPEVTTRRSTTLEERPYAEREHALSMLHSLQDLGNKANSLVGADKKEPLGSARNSPPAPGPSTLHSLALYFATAGDNFDSSKDTESASGEANEEDDAEPRNSSIVLPTSILTQHTIASYAELFNLNNALEGNATVAELAAEADDVASDDDLEMERSEGPLNGTNGTKLRELAQVFTHALSAYLQDPDTFKKVLTEIRPTEPSATTTDNAQYEMTTLYPTTAEEYASVTKEKDEVLDFSDDTDPARRRKPSTVFPTTLQSSVVTSDDGSYSTTHHSTTSYDGYHSTNQYSTRRPVYYPSTTLLPPSLDDSRDYAESSTQAAQGGNTFAFEVNRAFTTTTANSNVRGFDGDTRDTTDLSLVYDNYFPLEEEGGGGNKIGGFQNNTKAYQPYGKNVKPIGATPISKYVASSTPASFQNFQDTTITSFSWGKGSAGDKPIQSLTPPHYQRFGNVKNFEVSNSIVPNQIRSTTPLPKQSQSVYQTASSTVQPFRIRYYDSTTQPTTIADDGNASPESLVTARSSYAKYRNNYNRVDGTRRPAIGTTTVPTIERDTVETLVPISSTYSDADVTPFTTTSSEPINNASSTVDATSDDDQLNDDYWTSSPMVTQLWETTVFVDPRHINDGLESGETTSSTISDEPVQRVTAAATTARSSTNEVPEEARITTSATTSATSSTPSPWQWAPNDNNSPVAFTLLPTTFAAENTATPTPIITTRSTITTTITSSVTSTGSVPHDGLASTLLPFAVTPAGNALNASQNEVIKAQEMFGKLNNTSSDTLMRVMKQADNNETVRQLVLLLINNCNGPRNKTTEQEKEQLLDALLRTPVHEFSSEESREIVASINRLHLSDGKARSVPNFTTKTPRATTSASLTSEPSVTTFRSRTGRRFRTTTESASGFARRSDESVSDAANNSLPEDEATASDNRALELLRSLYTIAAKWG